VERRWKDRPYYRGGKKVLVPILDYLEIKPVKWFERKKSGLVGIIILGNSHKTYGKKEKVFSGGMLSREREGRPVFRYWNGKVAKGGTNYLFLKASRRGWSSSQETGEETRIVLSISRR